MTYSKRIDGYRLVCGKPRSGLTGIIPRTAQAVELGSVAIPKNVYSRH